MVRFEQGNSTDFDIEKQRERLPFASEICAEKNSCEDFNLIPRHLGNRWR